ncbi:DUF4169 family protein [Roseiterribacter gracilis]|uniref:DUF4169 domain-containing protein n=1 Tax=Roseiterribacter gracilis TaxID=2812848 RepID=A0A8S8XC90_9PROT|nr:hypothetical protein TMPK1_25410 [Rhodospirillales bacterium TMPK1]
MADIVNLRKARKDKARADKEKKAAENRVAFGRTKEDKKLSEAQRALEEARLAAHRKAPSKDDESTR